MDNSDEPRLKPFPPLSFPDRDFSELADLVATTETWFSIFLSSNLRLQQYRVKSAATTRASKIPPIVTPMITSLDGELLVSPVLGALHVGGQLQTRSSYETPLVSLVGHRGFAGATTLGHVFNSERVT